MTDKLRGKFSGLTDRFKDLSTSKESKEDSKTDLEPKPIGNKPEGHHAGFDEKLTLFKNKVGKIGNMMNSNHRHDEAHEKRTDAKRNAIAQSHRFGSFAPEHDGNKIKWYIDGRDYYWVS